MLFLGDLLLAFLIGIILTGIFAAAFRDFRTWDALLVFFLAIFLFSWAGGVWVAPFGPLVYDLYLFPFIGGGLLIALLMAAWFSVITPPTDQEIQSEVRQQQYASGGETILAALGALFWLYLIAMLVIIVISYLS